MSFEKTTIDDIEKLTALRIAYLQEDVVSEKENETLKLTGGYYVVSQRFRV